MRWAMDTFDRTERETREEQIKAEAVEYFAEAFPDSKTDVGNSLYAIMKEIVREKIVKEGIRPDGRSYEEVRPIWCETGLFARTAWQCVFTRGRRRL